MNPIILAAWLGAAATAVLAVAWIASGWVTCGLWLAGGRLRIGVEQGLVRFQNDGLSFRFQDIVPGAQPRNRPWSVLWWGHWYAEPGAWEAAAPIWVLGAITSSGCAICFWKAGRRANRLRDGLCVRCRYRLDGLAPGSPCPECGAARR